MGSEQASKVARSAGDQSGRQVLLLSISASCEFRCDPIERLGTFDAPFEKGFPVFEHDPVLVAPSASLGHAFGDRVKAVSLRNTQQGAEELRRRDELDDVEEAAGWVGLMPTERGGKLPKNSLLEKACVLHLVE